MNPRSSFFSVLALSLGIGVVNAAPPDPVVKIQGLRNETIDRIENACAMVGKKSECYVSELRALFQILTKGDPAVFSPSESDLGRYERDMDERLARYCLEKSCDLSRPQVVLYGDVSTRGQIILVWLLEGTKDRNRKYSFIGASKVSSGYPDPKPRNPAIETKFSTGMGVYSVNPAETNIVGYRAEGTKNRKGVRGYGERGNRIWDAGPMPTKRAWDQTDMVIRFMVHSTDPALESRFGSQSSQGCLRIPKTVNRFLEYSGALDAGYDVVLKRPGGEVKTAVLGLLGRNPRFSSVSGSLLVFGDGGADAQENGKMALNTKALNTKK